MASVSGPLPPHVLYQRIAAGVACVVAIWAGVKVAESPMLVFTALIAGAYVLTLTVNFRALAWLVIALQPAALIIPFLRGRPFFWELSALLAWPSLTAFFLVNRSRFEALRLERTERRALLALLGYVLVLGLLMGVRGVGFRVLGGEQMGGRFYVQQVILSILPLLMISARLSRRALVAAVATGWAMSLTYLVSDFALSHGNRAIQFLLFFFEVPTDALNFEFGYEFGGLRRYQSLAIVGGALLAAMWTLLPLRRWLGRLSFVGLPLMLGCLLLGLGSGHRTSLIVSMATLLLLTFFQRFWNPVRVAAAVVVGGAVLGAVYTFADELPLAVQRSVSFLPGIEVSPVARDDAKATIDDRIEVLKLALNDVPRFWLVGRGFGMERFDLVPEDPAHAGVWQQYINGSFYNGTIGLLLKTGLIGLACTLAYVGWISQAALDVLRSVRERTDTEWTLFDRFCLLLCAQWFATLGFFYLTHGDAGDWLQAFGLSSALILTCRRLLRENAEPAVAQPELANTSV